MECDNYRKRNIGKKHRDYTKNKAKKIKRDNFTRSNREKSNIAKSLVEKLIIREHHNYLHFGPPIIFLLTIDAHCIIKKRFYTRGKLRIKKISLFH